MNTVKNILIGVALLVILSVGALIYRNAVEHPTRQIACPLDAKVCPDGSSVARVGLACDFPLCPPPNVSLADTGLEFALPAGYEADENAAGDDPTMLGAFVSTTTASTSKTIIIRQFAIASSSTAVQVIHDTALGDASEAPVAPTAISSITLGNHHFSVVLLGRFEGVVHTAYYLVRENDVLRFDALDANVSDWTNPSLNTDKLPANQDLRALLTTLQGN